MRDWAAFSVVKVSRPFPSESARTISLPAGRVEAKESSMNSCWESSDTASFRVPRATTKPPLRRMSPSASRPPSPLRSLAVE